MRDIHSIQTAKEMLIPGEHIPIVDYENGTERNPDNYLDRKDSGIL